MTLTQWGSNCKDIGQVVVQEFGDACIENTINVLGLRWSVSHDTFEYECSHFAHNVCMTKKVMLGFISRLFDPLGFAMPFIMTARILFQEVWKLNIQREDLLPDHIDVHFQKWIKDFPILNKWKIPRKITHIQWCEILEFHVFDDASQ